jgi:hypothetical protein
MRKEGSFDTHWGDGWPDLATVEACVTDPVRRSQMLARGADGGCFSIEGLYGTENLAPRAGLVSATLYLFLSAEHGAMVLYSRWDGRIQKQASWNSKGDLSRLGQFVRSFHDTPLSLGLFISFENAWLAIKEFMLTEGELPTVIEWVATEDLPPETFPEPV